MRDATGLVSVSLWKTSLVSVNIEVGCLDVMKYRTASTTLILVLGVKSCVSHVYLVRLRM